MRTADTATPLEPACTEAERALLGACLLAPSHASRLLAGLTADHFTEGRALAVYAAINAILDADDDPDPITVLAHLRRTHHATGGRVFGDDPATVLADLMQSCPIPVAASHYRRLVAEYADRRALVAAAAGLDHAARAAESVTLGTLVANLIVTLTAYADNHVDHPAKRPAEQWDARAAA